jgi:phage terminase large subunit
MKVKVQPQYKELYTSNANIKCYWGGRSSGKSFSIADYILYSALRQSGTYLCGREFQNSIKESVHSLLCERIKDNGWDDYFSIKNEEIIFKIRRRYFLG